MRRCLIWAKASVLVSEELTLTLMLLRVVRLGKVQGLTFPSALFISFSRKVNFHYLAAVIFHWALPKFPHRWILLQPLL